jgi:DNA-directed RNA polymerase subunit RPC12/RpoP
MKGTKHCPYCGEEILVIAKKCKYCGEWQKEKPAPKEMIACPICGERIDRKRHRNLPSLP